jgi:hypothetical protein
VVDRGELVGELYRLLDELESRVGPRRTLSACSRVSGWPGAGVYFFFEPGEARADGVTPRVVRVGTHGLRSSKSTLWGRLAQHRGSVGGTRPGGGNHRGSIFRRHVGDALLNSGVGGEVARATWGVGQTAPASVMALEYELERAVSAVIGAMSVLWLPIDDPPDPTSARGVVESGTIAAVSNFGRPPIDPPSTNWLGRHASRREILESGLWNVNHVTEPPSSQILDVIDSWICRCAEQTTGK